MTYDKTCCLAVGEALQDTDLQQKYRQTVVNKSIPTKTLEEIYKSAFYDLKKKFR